MVRRRFEGIGKFIRVRRRDTGRRLAMCGICGAFYYDRTQHVDRSVVEAMNRQIIHRGPDEDGFYVSENIGLAMRRLSIIDLKSGQQPVTNEDGSIWLVYNGEIYNHQELRQQLEKCGHRYRSRSDTETIVHLYEEYGEDCVRHLRGMFAFAIWDMRRKKLFCARDRFGIKPFYYAMAGNRFAFASEIKALFEVPDFKPQLNRRALPEFFAFGYTSSEEPLFVGVRKLLPGHHLHIDLC